MAECSDEGQALTRARSSNGTTPESPEPSFALPGKVGWEWGDGRCSGPGKRPGEKKIRNETKAAQAKTQQTEDCGGVFSVR
jgi:hypothetical protein